MASFEHQFVCKIIETADLNTPQKMGITADKLYSAECRSAYTLLLTHFLQPQTYGQVLSWQLFQQYVPNFPWVPASDSLEMLCNHLNRQSKRDRILRAAQEIAAQADLDPDTALLTLKEAGARLGSAYTTSRSAFMADYCQTFVDWYAQGAGACTGIPWAWEYLTSETGGVQKGNYIFIYGRPGNMKSFLALIQGSFSYSVCRRRVLIWSGEQQEDEQQLRTASILSRVDLDKLTKRQLEPSIYKSVVRVLSTLSPYEQKCAADDHHRPMLNFILPRNLVDRTVGSIIAQAEELEVDLLIVDGVYKLYDERTKSFGRDRQALDHITSALQSYAMESKVPVIAVTQQCRNADKKLKRQRKPSEDLDDLAYGDSQGQDADLAIHVRHDEVNEELVLTFTKRRSGKKLLPMVLNAKPSTDWSFKRFHIEEPEKGGSDPQDKTHVTLPSNYW